LKHLLIIISFLLLSSPVIGNSHKGETLYRWGKYPDYKWMGFGDKDIHPKYQGQLKDGKPNGLGFIIHPNGEKYVGSWENGKQNGEGTLFWGGGKQIGEFRGNKPWNITEYDLDGKIRNKVVNGEWIKQ
jgi:hypothetical protein